ncbi:hypothetical protein R1sor_014467 [Riccia sorocarpa]|uniref:C2 domain-containing protein n=1 Tax=Riccia sorocarpa TaxID=122646 RepID=A0ABD3H9G2_9MARC
MSKAASGIQGQILEVNVVGCKNLSDKEWFGRQDPYVIVEYANNRFRTRTHTDGGRNPMFNEKFQISLIEGLRELTVQVWESNSVALDKHIGTAKVILERVLSTGYDTTPWNLTGRSARSAGEVNLILHYAGGKKDSHATSSYPTSHTTSSYPTSHTTQSPVMTGYPASTYLPTPTYSPAPGGYPNSTGYQAPLAPYPPQSPYPAAVPQGYPPVGAYPSAPQAYPAAAPPAYPPPAAPYPAPSPGGYPPPAGYPAPTGYPGAYPPPAGYPQYSYSGPPPQNPGGYYAYQY